MTKPEYHAYQVGHTCRQCGAHFLVRRPWRRHYCLPCWQKRLARPGLLTAGFTLGILTAVLLSGGFPEPGLIAIGAVAVALATGLILAIVIRR